MASAGGGVLPLPDFIAWALYDPVHGYYQASRQRVGRSDESDFYTASSMGPVFARLVADAALRLIDGPSDSHVFVEIGPESTDGLLGHLAMNPFGGHRLIRPGSQLDLPPRAIVFSNEVFDAQPFRRLVYRSGRWRELGVALQSGQLAWAELPGDPSGAPLPDSASEGYTLDWPSGAHDLLQNLVQAPWQGLFIAFDYGHESQTLLQLRPEGTGRTYSRHRMGADLLDAPGQLDITCHVAWDVLEAILREAGFSEVQLLSQEAFLVRYGQSVIREIVESAGSSFSRERQSLMELLHPANMGRKFQVLTGRRYSA